jgi:hypothetical protein
MRHSTGPWAKRWDFPTTPGQADKDQAREEGWDPSVSDWDKPGPEGPWVRFYRVTTTDGPVTVDVTVGRDPSGKLALYGIATDKPLTTRLFSVLPLDALKKAAAEAIGEQAFHKDLSRIAKRDRTSVEFLGEVAAISRAALSRGAANQAVADATGVSVGQAKRYIAAAREAGLDVIGGSE